MTNPVQLGTATMSEMRLNKLEFAAGPSVSDEALAIEMSTVLILVGPNNSGKSLSLKELENWCLGTDQDRVVLSAISATFPDDPDEAFGLLKAFEVEPPKNILKTTDRIWVGQHTFRGDEVLHRDVHIESFRQIVEAQNEQQLREYLLRMYTMRLDGRTRFTLSDPKSSGDLQGAPQNHLWSLFQDDAARNRVRKLTEEAFGLSFVVDPTAMTQFRIRMSDRPPADSQEEQALDERSRDFHGSASLVSDLSDGVQAFTGLVSAVLSLPHKILLIDEPEAFLHPPLARRLGRNLSQLAESRSANLIVATHSADFVMGCVESSASTTIVRLTYEQESATARMLSPEDLSSIMKKPLLRSTKALQGLFHKTVVVTEADTDRAFYDEINFRLNQENRGIEDALFVNAQNWQTVPEIIEPLRSVGVPAAGVLDLDAVASSQSWSKLYKAAGIKDSVKQALELQRLDMRDLLKRIGPPGFKQLGIRGLKVGDRERMRRFINKLGTYGVFVVPVGEVEMWLATLGISGKKSWLIRIFEAMGSDSDGREYVKPAKRDVWGFMDGVGRWAGDPNRKGL